MPKIPEETIEQIAAANDIVEVIGGYIPLKRAGSNFRALCPFHKEKTPSFHVNPQRQSYHCFGCGEGGSVFRFVMAYENIDFPSAARKLAERAGIRIVEAEFSAEEDQRSKMRRRLLALHQQAAEWFHRNLLRSESAKAARDYLKGRGLTAEVAKAWKIGYAPDSWDALGDWAQSEGFTVEELIASGLVSLKDEEEGSPEGRPKFYDRFRDRVMFPICNAEGEVIAFSGRVLQADAKSAKYVNSPETILFTKGNVLFGLHKSKRPLLDKGFAIVCEGQIDLISAFEAGVQNVIAPQGTAFTEKQTRILKRYVEEVVLCFDSDAAGQKAADRSLPSLLGENLSVRVMELPAGEDPDSLIRKEGVEAFSALVANAKDFFDYQIERGASSPDFATARGKMQFARKMAAWVSLITDTMLREAVSNKVATRMEISRLEFVKLLKQPQQQLSSKSVSRPDAGESLESLRQEEMEGNDSVDLLVSDSAATNMIHVALMNAEARSWLKQQDWKSFLANEPSMELLIKVLAQDIVPGDNAGINSWLSTLPGREEAVIRQIIEKGIPPISQPSKRAELKRPEEVVGISWHPLKTAQDSWRVLQRRQINRRLEEVYARFKPGLSPEEIDNLKKEIHDLQKQSTE